MKRSYKLITILAYFTSVAQLLGQNADEIIRKSEENMRGKTMKGSNLRVKWSY